jgi:hypothetical protein
MNAGTAPVRKPIHDTDTTPEVLKIAGIVAGSWFRFPRKHYKLLLSSLTDEERRFALVLIHDAFHLCELKHSYCLTEGIEQTPAVLNALLCMKPKADVGKDGQPKLDKDGQPRILYGQFEPTTLISVGLRAGFGKRTAQEQANRAARGLEVKGLLTREGDGKRGRTRLWLHADPEVQAARRRKMVNDSVYFPVSSPPPVLAGNHAKEDQEMLAQNHWARKRIFPAVARIQRSIGHLEFKNWTPELFGDPRYTEGVERIVKKLSTRIEAGFDQYKADAEEELAALATQLRRTNGNVNASVHRETKAEGNASVQQTDPTVNGSGAAYKEERVLKESIETSSSLVRSLGEQLRARVNIHFDDDASRRLLSDCQKACQNIAPAVTIEEIVTHAHAKARQLLQRGHGVRNPVGMLLAAIPKGIRGWVVESRRYESEQTAAGSSENF